MTEPMTTEELLDLAQHRINSLPAGEYQVSEVFGELYDAAISDPKNFGKLFKKACKSGRLSRIQYSHMNEGNKHLYYSVG